MSKYIHSSSYSPSAFTTKYEHTNKLTKEDSTDFKIKDPDNEYSDALQKLGLLKRNVSKNQDINKPSGYNISDAAKSDIFPHSKI